MIILDSKRGKKLKTAILLILLFFVCQSNAFANEKTKYVRMEIKTDSEFYRATNYKQRSSSLYSIFVEERYTKYTLKRLHGVASRKFLYVLNCDKKLYTIELAMNFDSKGKIMGGGSTPDFGVRSIGVDTVEESLYKTICL
jgi:hypothetical protein